MPGATIPDARAPFGVDIGLLPDPATQLQDGVLDIAFTATPLAGPLAFVHLLINDNNGGFAHHKIDLVGGGLGSVTMGDLIVADFVGTGHGDIAIATSAEDAPDVFTPTLTVYEWIPGNPKDWEKQLVTFVVPLNTGSSGITAADIVLPLDAVPIEIDVAISVLGVAKMGVAANDGMLFHAFPLGNPPFGASGHGIAAIFRPSLGLADLVTTAQFSEPALLNVARNDGFGFFDDNDPIPIDELSSPVGVVGGKINVDGTFDIAVACITGNAQHPRGGVAVIPMRINGTFAGHTIFEVDDGAGPAPQPTFLEIGDLNLDGKPDLVVSLGGSGKISVLINASQP